MSVNEIKSEFGTVVGQLLEYKYEAIAEGRRTKGQEEALVSAQGWIESILAPYFQPKGPVLEQFHNHDAATCDAVQIRYPVGPAPGELELLVSQSLFVITVSVLPRVPPSSWRSRNEEPATEFAGRLFKQSERIKLRLEKERNGVLLGRQVIAENAGPGQMDWLDSLTWWLDGTSLGFSVLKQTGGDQPAITSSDLQPNQVWFRMFEQPRFR